nr:hypothetical protein HJG63_008408 [Rousettus aegyptiacus]
MLVAEREKLKDKLVNQLRENAEIQETMTPTRDHPRGVPGWAITLQMKTDWSGDSRRSSPVKQTIAVKEIYQGCLMGPWRMRDTRNRLSPRRALLLSVNHSGL